MDKTVAYLSQIEETPINELVTVFNFEVEDWNTYYVSQLNILVHNKPQRAFKKPKPGSGKERASNIPHWAKGQRPYVGESGKDFARRVLDEKYGKINHDTGPRSEFNMLKKYGDRGFE